jgi:prepilin-type N-terminal cleavage/methylation domain-containing protein
MKRGFTLLEVVIALAVLAVSLFVLVDAQGVAVVQTLESRRILVGTWLAQEKMAEVQFRVEKEGFGVSDINEEGDFSTLGADGQFGDGVDLGDDYDDYRWAYTVREVDLQMGDISGSSDQLQAAGFGPSQESMDRAQDNGVETPDLSNFVSADQLTQMLSPYLREVRVVVWWGEDDPPDDAACEDCVELVTHFINPTGQVFSSGGSSDESSSSSGSSGGSTSGGSGASSAGAAGGVKGPVKAGGRK